MSQAVFSGSKVFRPKPPDKGSFPLDHEGECKVDMETYMKCLSENKYDNSKCRLEAKDYLDCRMQKELMAKEPWTKLGYGDLNTNPTTESTSSTKWMVNFVSEIFISLILFWIKFVKLWNPAPFSIGEIVKISKINNH